MKSYDKYKNPSAVWAGYVFPSRYTASIAKKYSQACQRSSCIHRVAGGYVIVNLVAKK